MDRVQLPSNVTPVHYDLSVIPNPESLSFIGSVRITVDVHEATSEIVLNAADLQCDRAVLHRNGEELAAVRLDAEQQTVTLGFAKAIEPGAYDLSIDYRGKIYESAQGLFILRYDTPQGRKHMLVTQFEAVAARRLIPCWDEPARKATFSISVVTSRDELAVSNMPAEETSELDDGRLRIRFQKSPKMSSYLLFLGMGELERLEATTGSIRLAVLARKGSAYKGKFALESAVRLLEYYNDYFGVPYPLPKLDLIAAPGAGGFSAMENWGAILYFENSLLIDPNLSTESDRQRVFVVVAHEMAHQWFGNLVTMEWWDNLWLNEGFASWMENKATDRFHPEWMMWLQSESARQRAMRQDAKRTTHPVVQPVTSGEQADQAFDDITYRKGQAVIRMLESYLGEEAFQAGVRAYMKRYAYQNTVTDNLWTELEKAAGKAIKEIADDFTLQPGVPLITVEAMSPEGDCTTLTLRQGRFGVDDSAHDVLVWRTPVSAAPAGSATRPTSTLVVGHDPIPLPVKGKPPIKINIGQTSYYRSEYAGDAFVGLVDRFGLLSPADQLGLLYDAWALGEAGVAPVAEYLNLTRKVPLEADTTVWRQVIETLVSLDALYAGLETRAMFRAYARDVLVLSFQRIGWDVAPGEADNVAVLREDLLNSLGRFGEPSVLGEARRRFDAFVVDPRSLPAAIRRPTLRVVALWADQATYDVMHGLANNAADAAEKDQLFIALASAQDPALAARSLALALSNEPATTTGPSMIARVAVSNPDLAWQFALDHLDTLNARLDAMQRLNFVPSLAAQSTKPERLAELRHFIDSNVPAVSREQVERFYSDLAFRLKVRAERLPDVDQWLTDYRKELALST